MSLGVFWGPGAKTIFLEFSFFGLGLMILLA